MRKRDAAVLVVFAVMVGIGLWRLHIPSPYVSAETTTGVERATRPNVEVDEMSMQLTEAGFIEAINALLSVQGQLPEFLFGSFKYVTVTDDNHTYYVSFSDEKPKVMRKVTNSFLPDHEFFDGQKSTSFVLSRDKDWYVARVEKDYFLIRDNQFPSFRTVELEKLKPRLISKH